MNSKIATIQPDLSQQTMPRETDVHFGHQFDSRAHALAIRLAGVEFMLAQVVIDMPHASPSWFRDASQQRRPAALEADGWKPAFGDEFIAARGLGTEAFHKYRANLVIDRETEAEHARASCFGSVLVEKPTRSPVAA